MKHFFKSRLICLLKYLDYPIISKDLSRYFISGCILLTSSLSYAFTSAPHKALEVSKPLSEKEIAAQQKTNPNGYAVATAHPLASNIGLSILEKGGNAFDAAVAIGAALAVVEPYHSGLGGGGFWLLHDSKLNKNIFIDAREVAPGLAKPNMFLDKTGEPIPKLSLTGGLAAGIPGEPAALVYIAEHFGKLPLKETLAPAIKLAEEGFIVDHQFCYFSTMDDRLKTLKSFPSTAAIFLNNQAPFTIGQILKQKDLAKTLKILADKGHVGFYEGPVAEALVKSIRNHGGIWTLTDLSRYQIKIREPLVVNYKNLSVITAPLPSAGGIALITMLNILNHFPIKTFNTLQQIHYVAEAMRLAYWQRDRYLADPDYENVPIHMLLSPQNVERLASLIPEHKALKSQELKHLNQQPSFTHTEKNTTHIAIMDKEGNRVSATMSINYIFGSGLVAEGTGVLLNNEMDDFSTKEGVQSVYGIVGSNKNQIQPGKRPLSSMTPTFLESKDSIAILGTPGGSRIPTMLLIAALKFAEEFGAISLVSTMRFHHQYLPDYLQIEPESFSTGLQSALKAMGYNLMPLKEYYGDMQAITWNKSTQTLTAASDPRHIGLAAAISDNHGGYGFNY